ncbi:MAG: glycine zipper 2TM domain-containing protein [Proteobacteria bacterium]|nr:MAG: glycine zipper 2TM domain-containing protein [Pseudomonadota bacterium]
MDLGNCNRTLIGTVIGGVGGGVIGSMIGKGSGNTLAIIGGTILGAIVGAGVGDTMDNLDQNCVGQTLEHAPDGQTIKWNSPDANTKYQVTPTESYRDAIGRYCRKYTTNATIGGQTEKIYGTSCRQPDGSWKLVS